MIVFPNAKINLGLHITGRLPDGYHSIETLFYPVPWYDILEVMERRNAVKGDTKVSLHTTGLKVEGTLESNLCYKAYALLAERYDLPAVDIFLHKQIPMGAGLGGGSSDAAFTLTALNTMFHLQLDQQRLMQYAMELGADCAFFILNASCYATGKGEQLVPVDFSLKGNYLVIIKPDIAISTAQAYSQVLAKVPDTELKDILSMPDNTWKQYLKNNFERHIFVEHPDIEKCKNILYEKGAWYASMSGSGSAVFGLFKEIPPELTRERCIVWTAQLP